MIRQLTKEISAFKARGIGQHGLAVKKM